MLTQTWKAATLSDVCDNGVNYMYSLMCDYERYIYNFGYIPVAVFLSGWTCITYKMFENLSEGDIVYSANGDKYIVVSEPYESDDETVLYIEVSMVADNGTYDNTGRYYSTFQSGDIYKSNVTHDDYRRKKIKIKESEEPLCPILITKTNQPQS